MRHPTALTGHLGTALIECCSGVSRLSPPAPIRGLELYVNPLEEPTIGPSLARALNTLGVYLKTFTVYMHEYRSEGAAGKFGSTVIFFAN
jgi:hypothetical protein